MIFALGWTVMCLFAVYWNIVSAKDKTLDLAQKEAETIIDKDQAFRFWATDHSGVYVPVTATTPPNENLKDIPERDIVTPSGRHLTLMNPAYILRQVMDKYTSLYAVKGHLVSLKALNSINTPDAWETASLQQFDSGKKEIMAVTTIDDKEYFRLIRPMYTQVGCLKCHAQQGYQEGDLRGGVSVSIPLAPYREMEGKTLRTLHSTLLFFWSMGLFVIGVIFNRNKKRLMERLAADQILREQSQKIELFTYSVAHDLKNPAVAMLGLAKLLNKKHQRGLDEKGRQVCAQIEKSAQQITALVDQINTFISAKEYPLTIELLDFREICRAIKEENAARLQARKITWSEPQEGARIRADKIAILRIIRNLVDNALKYGGENLSKIVITCKESEKFHTIRVSNDGTPIATDDCRNLFLIFKRNCADKKVEGTGLGLAIVKELVGRHGGRVWGESDGRNGVTFSFTIAKKVASTPPLQ
jgi:hypothetical protein